jgi:hypothetical protein
MTFVTDGTPHHDGVQKEHDTIKLINEHPNLTSIRDVTGTLTHKGGTRSHSDAVNERGEGVSLKCKSSNSGSTDWRNMSLKSISDADRIMHFIRKHEEIKRNYRYMYDRIAILDFRAKEDLTENVRAEYKKLSHDILKTIDYKTLVKQVYDTHESKWVVYHTIPQRKLVLFQKEELLRLWKEPGELRINNGSASGVIENTCGLRLRITLNNGVKALLGRGSCLTAKIQQDNPQGFIDALEHSIVCDY